MYLIKKTGLKTAFSIMELSVVIAIISIIIGAITVNKYLIKTASFSSLRSLSVTSPVYNLKDNSFWLDVSAADIFNSVPSSGDKVSSIFDVNPNLETNVQLIQNSTSNQPEFIIDTIDNLPALRFDGNDKLVSSSQIIGFDLFKPSQFTIFLVQKYYSPNHIAKVLSWDDNFGSEINIEAADSSGYINFKFGGSEISAPTSNFTNNWQIITIKQSMDNIATISVNSIDANSDSLTPASSMISQSSFLEIGSGLNGEIREIIIFKKELSDENISDIEKYLANKWQINID
jgi:hypothetical protein